VIAEFGMQNAEFLKLRFQSMNSGFYSALRNPRSEIVMEGEEDEPDGIG
jgi:hypothetical protein